MKSEAPQASQGIVRLVEGLPAQEIIGIVAASIRDRGIENRIQAFYLHDMKKRRSYQEAGFSSIENLTRMKFDMSASSTRELIACGRALHELAQIDLAFAEERICWSKVRILARIAVPETEAAWLERALEQPVRELQLEIKGAEQGRPPRKERKGLPTVKFKHEFEFDAVEQEMFELMRKKVSQETGEALSEKAALTHLIEERLRKETRSGEPDSRRLDDSLFRVVIDECSTCGESSVRTDAGPIALEPATANTLSCDAPPPVVVGPDDSLPSAEQGQGLTPRKRKEILIRDGHRCLLCARAGDSHVHHIILQSEGGDHRSSNLATVCSSCHSLIHEGFMQLHGTAPHDLLFLDRDGKELSRPAAPVTEARHQLERPVVARATNGEPASTEVEIPISKLPREVSPEWWHSHAHLFAWNDRRGVLEYTSGCPRDPVSEEDDGDGRQTEPPSSQRPRTLDAIIGQARIVRALEVATLSARHRGCPVDHTLLCGPPGLGKTTLARAVATEMGTRSFTTSGAALRDAGAMVGLLSKLSDGDVLFLDEIHALPRKIAEMLYEAMEDLKVSLPVVSGADARTLTMRLLPMTVIGATTDQDLMPPPLLARFGIQQDVEFYSEEELMQIVHGAAKKETIDIEESATRALARASHATPRRALALFRCARDETVSHVRQNIDLRDVLASFASSGLDRRGLGPIHQKAIALLQNRKRPLGVARLAALLGISKRTFRQIYEPALMRLDLIVVTPRGLMAAPDAVSCQSAIICPP